MQVSILIPVYNKAFVIGKILEKLCKQITKQDEIIVLDDGSEDNSIDIIYKHPVRHIIRWRENDLFRLASTRNWLVREATNDHLIFLSGDCVPDDDYVKIYKETFEKIEPRTIIRGIVHHRKPIPFREGYHYDWERMRGTGNIGLRKWDFNLIGGLDENFDGGWGHEDREFAYRAVTIYRYRIYCAPAGVTHTPHPRKDVHGNRNLAYFKEKHGLLQAETKT